MNTPIHDFLEAYSKKNQTRCHMPGAKGNVYPFDITEIDGADSLYESCGIIAESERNAASLFGAGKTLYSCSGSTLAIQTMLALVKAYSPQKRHILAYRYAHKSLVSCCALLGLEIDWIYPDEYLSCKITPGQVEEKINSETLAVFTGGVDYYGGICDTERISEVCKRHSVPLLVDNAHGAYRVFDGSHPILHGAAMTADSAHKTLPCITGGAYLHIAKNAEKYYPRAKEIMAAFGTSSPSYLILDSLDLCNRHIEEKKSDIRALFDNISRLKQSVSALGFAVRQSDAMRITISALESGYSGFDLGERLKKEGVECEFSDLNNVVLLFSTISGKDDFFRVFSAFAAIKPRMPVDPIEKFSVTIPTAEQTMPLSQAFFAAQTVIPLQRAFGRVCGTINAPCPPCIPIIMPGERYSADMIQVLEKIGVADVSVVT